MQPETWLTNPAQLDKVAIRTEREHSSRLAEIKTYLRYYYDRPVIGGVDYTRPYRELAVFDALKKASTGNLTREVVDAATAILCRDMAAKVLPKGADFKLEQGCKQASRLIEGVFDNSDFLSIATQAARDGMTADIGPIKGYVDPESEEIRFQRMNPLETYWVDDGTDNPRTFIEISPASKDFLIAKYPQHKSRIRDLPNWSPPVVVGVDPPGTRNNTDTNTVRLVEGWCRAFNDSSPGRHVVQSGDIVFENDEWAHDITPVFSFTWSPDFRGYGGVPLARIVAPYDSANRRLVRMVYAGLAGAVPWLVYQEDEEPKITDIEFQRVPYKTSAPQVVIPQTVSPEVLAAIERNRQLAFAEGGVNQGMATGNAPARYTSGAAQREYVDIANTRLLLAQKQWERLWKQAARVVVMLAQQARKAHVRVKGANHYESVSFPKLSRDQYKIHFGLSSGLSLTPAARLQELQDLKDSGLADVADMARNLNLPDTQALSDRLNAPRDLIMRQVSMALDHGVRSMPSAMQDLPALIKIASEEYQRAQMQGNYPPAHLEVLRRLIKAAQARLAPPPAPPVAPAVAPAPVPPTEPVQEPLPTEPAAAMA